MPDEIVPRGRGRPRIELDRQRVTDVATTGAPLREMAAWFGCSVDTLMNNYSDEIAQGRELGKISLRRKQMTLALQGNVAMLIWLGKQKLGQTEKVSQEISGPAGGPIETMATDGASQVILKKLQEIANRQNSTDVDDLTERRQRVVVSRANTPGR